MKRFYIIFRDLNTVEGKIDCTEEDFVKWFINPNKENVYSYQIRDTVEVITEIEELIRQL